MDIARYISNGYICNVLAKGLPGLDCLRLHGCVTSRLTRLNGGWHRFNRPPSLAVTCWAGGHFLPDMQTSVTPARQLLAILNGAADKAAKQQAKKELKAAYPLMYQVWTSNNR